MGKLYLLTIELYDIEIFVENYMTRIHVLTNCKENVCLEPIFE